MFPRCPEGKEFEKARKGLVKDEPAQDDGWNTTGTAWFANVQRTRCMAGLPGVNGK